MNRALFSVMGVALATALAAVTLAQPNSTPASEERARIEAALRVGGFEAWGSIGRDRTDDVWLVDDAHPADGWRLDVHLAVGDLREARRKPA